MKKENLVKIWKVDISEISIMAKAMSVLGILDLLHYSRLIIESNLVLLLMRARGLHSQT